MKILHGYKKLEKQLKDPIIAIGIFDGIHLGHKRVISRVLNKHGKNRDKRKMCKVSHVRAESARLAFSRVYMLKTIRLTVKKRMC